MLLNELYQRWFAAIPFPVKKPVLAVPHMQILNKLMPQQIVSS